MDNNIEEYQGELDRLAEERDLLDGTIADCTTRKGKIKTRIEQVSDLIAGKEKRAVMPVSWVVYDEDGEELETIEKQWDRRIVRTGGGVNLDMMESMYGKKKFRKLVCDRIVSYIFNEDKYNESREAGEITDEHILKCTQKPKIGSALYLSKRSAVVEDDEMEYNSIEE